MHPRQWFKALSMLLGWLALIAGTLVLFLISFVPPLWHSAGYRWLFRVWSRVWVVALGVDLRLHTHAPLPSQFLLIANHPSAFEDIGIPALFDVDSLAKQQVRKWFLVGRISACAGTLFVNRNSRESRQAAKHTIINSLRNNRNVALYPEGGVFSHRLHDKFQHGAFDISLQTGIPIVPVFIHYEDQMSFYWGHKSLPAQLLQIMRAGNKNAHYHLYPAFNPDDFSDKVAYCEHVYQCYLAWQKEHLDA